MILSKLTGTSPTTQDTRHKRITHPDPPITIGSPLSSHPPYSAARRPQPSLTLWPSIPPPMDEEEEVRCCRTDLLVCSKARRGLTDSSISLHACSHPGTWVMIMWTIITCAHSRRSRTRGGEPQTQKTRFDL